MQVGRAFFIIKSLQAFSGNLRIAITDPLWWLNKKLYTVEEDLVMQVLVQVDS
jgi:hypothetical protein